MPSVQHWASATARSCLTNPSTGRHQRKHPPRFQTITYYELHSRIKGLANTWRHHEQHHVAPGDFVCILGFTGTDYATVDLACAYALAVSVPLQSTLAGADLDGIFTDTAPTAVVATVDDLCWPPNSRAPTIPSAASSPSTTTSTSTTIVTSTRPLRPSL